MVLRRALGMGLGVASVALLCPVVAAAASIQVSTTEDQYGSAVKCSLREAVTSANLDIAFGGCSTGAGADTILVPSGSYGLARVGAGEQDNVTGDLNVTSSDGTSIQASPPSAKVVVYAETGDRVLSHVGAGSLTLTGFTIRGGAAPSGFDGGGVLNTVGSLTMDGMTLSGNSAPNDGGGLANYATATVLNSTLSGNGAGLSGGGVYSVGSTTTTLRNVTVAANVADADANGTGGGGGVANAAGGALEAVDTIIAGNADDTPSPGSQAPDCETTTDFHPRYTLTEQPIGSGACAAGGPLTGNLTGSPLLQPLAANGGPTETMALSPASPAIDAGASSGPDQCLPVDQRGVSRPAGSCDLGAFEYVPPATGPPGGGPPGGGPPGG